MKITAKTGSGGATPTLTVANEDSSSLSLSAPSTNTEMGLYFYDSQGSSIHGLGNLCDPGNPVNWGTTAYFGDINRSTAGNDFWVPQSIDAAGAPVDVVAHIQTLLDKIDEFASDDADGDSHDSTIYALSGYDNWRSIGNQLSKDQRTFAKPETVEGGYTGVRYERAVFVRDRDAPATKIRFFNPQTCYRYMPEDIGPITITGSMWSQVSNLAGDGRVNDAYIMRLRTYQQIYAVLCNGNGSIYGLDATR